MTALTNDRPTAERAGVLVSDPVAAAAMIYAGSMYVLDGTGNATPATAAATTPVRAVARKRAVQADGDELTDGARGTFCFDNTVGDAITRAHIGANAYAADDQSVSATGTCVAGEVLDVDDGGVWVCIGTRVA